MSDLTDEELDSIERSLNWPDPIAITKSETSRLLNEIRRHRSALAADRERVRSVVREELDRSQWSWTSMDAFAGKIANAIATRAAEQLATAGVGLSETDRNNMRALLEMLEDHAEDARGLGQFEEAALNDEWHGALSRLIGASK